MVVSAGGRPHPVTLHPEDNGTKWNAPTIKPVYASLLVKDWDKTIGITNPDIVIADAARNDHRHAYKGNDRLVEAELEYILKVKPKGAAVKIWRPIPDHLYM